MAALTSTVPAVKAALVSLITTALADSTVQVVYGRPADNLLQRECIYAGNVRGNRTIPVIRAGRKPREERYTVEVVVAVLVAGGSVQEAETRAYVLLEAVEDAVADDPTLGAVNGLIHAQTGDFEDVSDYTQEGPAAVLRCDVDCLARLA